MTTLEWLKPELFESILPQIEGDYQEIKKFSAKPAFEGGENYLSILWSVDIEVKLKDESSKCLKFMLKIAPEAQQALAVVNAMGFFQRELTAYHDMLPTFEELYKNNGGVSLKFGPNTYKFQTDVGAADIVLMEDIRGRGFQNMNRFEGLDMEHTKSALKKLAQFHAASAKLVADKGALPDIYMKPMMNERMLAAMSMSQKPQEQKLLESLPLYKAEELRKDIENYQKVYISEMLKSEQLADDGFYVLSHGDCWSNNIMFKHDEQGHIEDTLFVDFQVGRYVLPSLDLQYFILCSTQLDIKLKYFDFFVAYYHKQLVASLKLLKYEKRLPTLKELHITMFDYSFIAYTTILKPLAVALLDLSASADLNLDNVSASGKDGGAMLTAMYTNDNYVRHLQQILPWMKNRGYFG